MNLCLSRPMLKGQREASRSTQSGVRLGQSRLVVFKPELTSCTPCPAAIACVCVLVLKKINFIMMDHNLWSILMNLFSKKINFIMMDHNLWSILMNLFFKQAYMWVMIELTQVRLGQVKVRFIQVPAVGRTLSEPILNLTQPNLSQLNHDPRVGLKNFQMFPKETFENFLTLSFYELQALRVATGTS